MKKILFFLLAASVLFLSSCLKDKRFDNNEIGVQDLGSSPKGISFPSTTKSFAVTSSSSPEAFTSIAVTLNGSKLPTTDVKFTIAVDPSKIPAGTVILPASSYTFDANGVVPAGSETGFIKFTLLNSGLLDPNAKYAIAFTITSVDNGYVVAQNAKTVVVTFSIKNRYDGIYRVTGTYQDFVNPLFTGRYPLIYHLITTGPNSVDVALDNINGAIVPGYLFNAAGAASFFGSFGLTMSFDPTTNAVATLHNYYGDPTKAPTAVGTPSTGSGAPNYISQPQQRRAVLDASGLNRYDPATTTVNIKYFMIQLNQATGTNPRGAFNETWVRTGPRP